MKFHCEYCREQIDAEVDKKCPNCGATYKNNKEYKKLLEEKEKQKEEIKQQKEYIQKTFKRVGITTGIGAIIITIISFAIMGAIIYIGVKNAKKINNDYDDVFNDVEERIQDKSTNVEEEQEIEPIIVNEEKFSNDYRVKFKKYRLIGQKDNKEYDKLEVTLIVEKISDKFSAWGEEIYCIVNDVSQKTDHFNSDLSTYIKDKGIPESKKITFYIPKKTTSFDIKYGNEVSFHVDIKND